MRPQKRGLRDKVGEASLSDLNIFYCIYTHTKGLNTSSYNLRGSYLPYLKTINTKACILEVFKGNVTSLCKWNAFEWTFNTLYSINLLYILVVSSRCLISRPFYVLILFGVWYIHLYREHIHCNYDLMARFVTSCSLKIVMSLS